MLLKFTAVTVTGYASVVRLCGPRFTDALCSGLDLGFESGHTVSTLSSTKTGYSMRRRHFGLAAYYAYRTYNDSFAWQLALSTWEFAYLNFVTGTDARAGPPADTTNFTTQCARTSFPLPCNVDCSDNEIEKLAGGIFVVSRLDMRARCQAVLSHLPATT